MRLVVIAAGDPSLRRNGTGQPLCLQAISGKTVLERLLRRGAEINARVTVIADDAALARVSALNPIFSSAEVVRLQADTRGSACTALMVLDVIDNSEELLLVLPHSQGRFSFLPALQNFRATGADAGVVTSAFPAESAMMMDLDDDGCLMEARAAVRSGALYSTGVYWYRHGSSFVAAAKSLISVGRDVNGAFPLTLVLNELVLAGKTVGIWKAPETAKRTAPDRIEHAASGFVQFG